MNHIGIESCGDNLTRVFLTFDITRQDRIENIVGREFVLVCLVGFQFGAGRLGDGAFGNPLACRFVQVPGQVIDHCFGHVADNCQATGHVAVKRAVSGRQFALVSGRQRKVSAGVGKCHDEVASDAGLDILIGRVGAVFGQVFGQGLFISGMNRVNRQDEIPDTQILCQLLRIGEAVIAAYAQKGYIMDPHTATCMKAYKNLREEKLPTVIYSTAEWTKFSSTVSKALGNSVKDDMEALKWVAENANVSVPPMINDLFSKPVIHTVVVDKESIKGEMLSFL